MNFEKYNSDFRDKALNQGYSENEIALCISYAQKLFNNDVPIIYNTTHFSRLVGFEKKYVIQAAIVSKHSETYYRYHKVKKRNSIIYENRDKSLKAIR